MNSLFEAVLWGAPVLLLSWGVLLTFACTVLFNESLDASSGEARH
jgi:hypothetical protein